MDDARWMRAALTLARRALGRTWPNPAVGCVLVRDDRVIGRGTTADGGRPHAEAVALASCADPKGATAYVTLEPCAHHGRTPPCADALVAAGIARVVCPLGDPDPRVAGRGFEALKAAGIQVDVGCLAEQARAVNAGFLSRIERGRPEVTLKLATTLDARIATRTGESRWITGPAARRRVHLMRATSDAVMIGAGTARTDDPMLDVRDIGLGDRAPVRVVIDGALSLPLTGRLLRTAKDQPLWLMHRHEVHRARAAALEEAGVTLIPTPSEYGALDMTAALQELGNRGLTRVLVEGGGRLAASLLQAGLVDRLVIFSAGKAFGNDGVPAVQGFGLAALADAPGFVLERVAQVGDDVMAEWSAA
ncbi:MAG: bifunctional diaminohydroxyphosphoribosylaminopyrimidine deaminase/5-amino-6-(5-phosphoribosylamino)uracil reductase RibD [Pseudomonadota bacterium]